MQSVAGSIVVELVAPGAGIQPNDDKVSEKNKEFTVPIVNIS